MGHFAYINADKVVTKVITGADEENEVPNGFTSWEEYYEQFENNCTVIRTSYNTVAGNHLNGGTALRGNYASKDMIYDETNDVFYHPQPYPSWVLNETSWTWEAPIARPADENGKTFEWNETNEAWEEILDPNITVD
tara:strand:+ start:57 stop:467 length:411 start_codon:yes stop_codon:yes gene_type:complete